MYRDPLAGVFLEFKTFSLRMCGPMLLVRSALTTAAR